MNLTNSLLRDLVTEFSSLRPQIYFKSSLIALASAMEDLVLVGDDNPLVIAGFQEEHFFSPSERRFSRIAQKTDQAYMLAMPDNKSGFLVKNASYETISLAATDTLVGEKFLVVIGQQYTACLVGQEKLSLKELREMKTPVEPEKRFEGFWTFDEHLTKTAADWLLGRIQVYRPDLAEKIAWARQYYLQNRECRNNLLLTSQAVDLDIFTKKLVTYLQAGQYKLIKAYKAIAVAERKEHLINKISQKQRNSLDAAEILTITVRELGEIFPHCRCLLYPVKPNETEVTIEHEFVPAQTPSLVGQKWSVVDNPIFIVAQTQESALVINDVAENIYLQDNGILKEKIERAAIASWLMVAIRYQDKLLGVLELHYGDTKEFNWEPEDIALVEAVANSTGTALTQASAYTNLMELNQKLAAVERIQNNLIAVVGHELKTPLSTIRIFLESLANEPDMPQELQGAMLDLALSDSERLDQLIKDFLTISKLEAGKAYCDIELVDIKYPLDLALHRITKKSPVRAVPKITVKLSDKLLAVSADVEGLVEVFYKLLDNACKFTPAEGEIMITAGIDHGEGKATTNGFRKQTLVVTIADTGRGIEPEQLKQIFARFSQSENYLRRTTSGIGLGLVICRQIINGMGGKIWATSEGKNQGSQFHFTIPLDY
ncbi:histidine kinase,histidine kinase,GAF domain-containing protein [Xenococcus sp. PCC 7305]|uniref:DICT sensory domain-containing protein n=1 Tax=Xenococcus sp. PCC 7305 TaxID=102125 RepID=UPI0002ACE85F|nr:DICT sensory domain-containing protein [Xenococcus sp. PCC 7305]ELS00333.1 histidine kinase,histidine kinase,GAF domain-containing protein [Xenococcus sp. PCC 7305]